MVLEIKTVEDFKQAIGNKSAGLVIIDFFADWCGPCQRIAPFYASLEKKYPAAAFYKLNADTPELDSIVFACDVFSLPSFCFFVGGECIYKLVGANEVAIEEQVVKNLAAQNN